MVLVQQSCGLLQRGFAEILNPAESAQEGRWQAIRQSQFEWERMNSWRQDSDSFSIAAQQSHLEVDVLLPIIRHVSNILDTSHPLPNHMKVQAQSGSLIGEFEQHSAGQELSREVEQGRVVEDYQEFKQFPRHLRDFWSNELIRIKHNFQCSAPNLFRSLSSQLSIDQRHNYATGCISRLRTTGPQFQLDYGEALLRKSDFIAQVRGFFEKSFVDAMTSRLTLQNRCVQTPSNSPDYSAAQSSSGTSKSFIYFSSLDQSIDEKVLNLRARALWLAMSALVC